MGSYYSEYFSSSIDSVAVDIFVYKYFALMREVVWYRIYSKRWKAELELVNTESFSRYFQSETISLQPTPGQSIHLTLDSFLLSFTVSLSFFLASVFLGGEGPSGLPWSWTQIPQIYVTFLSSASPSHLAETGKTVCFLMPWAGPFTSVYPIKKMGVGRG